MVSMVAHRSPKPFVRVRVLLPLPKIIVHPFGWTIFCIREGLEHGVPKSDWVFGEKQYGVLFFSRPNKRSLCEKVLLPLPKIIVHPCGWTIFWIREGLEHGVPKKKTGDGSIF